MSEEVFQRSLEALQAIGISDVRLTGGEPTTHPRFGIWVKKLAHLGFRVRLITNGTQAMRRHGPLDEVSTFWISCYGLTPEDHRAVAGSRAPDLRELMEYVGGLARRRNGVGLSALLQPGRVQELVPFLEDCIRLEIRRVRFLPMQPDGRARELTGVNWPAWEGELHALVTRIATERADIGEAFEQLTVNDVFGFDHSTHQTGCLLVDRRMFAITPVGDVFPCCFTAYERSTKICAITDAHSIDQLRAWRHPAEKLPPCRAFDPGFWGVARPGSIGCPIRAISMKADGELR